MIKSMAKITQISNEDLQTLENNPQLQGVDICLSTGLFRFSYYITKLGMSFNFGLSRKQRLHEQLT